MEIGMRFFFSLLHRACCFDYFFIIPTHALTIYTLKSSKFTLKHLKTLICPYLFRSILKTIFRGLVYSTLCSYQVEIGWCTLVTDLCSTWPYVITVRLRVYMEYLTGWNLLIELYDKVSHRQVLHIHTQTGR